MPPRPKKPSEKLTKSNRLLEAIRFLDCITKDEGAPFETHIILYNKTATAFNGVIAAGALIEEEITAAPHNKTLLNALQKCGEQFSLTQIDNKKLTIKSDKFKANIPCIDQSLLTFAQPDNPIAIIDDRIKEAFTVMDLVKVDNGQRVELLSFLMNGLSCVTTDGKIIIEHWHGIDLPPNLPVPKTIIPAILKNTKKLSKFGYSNSSVTFFFEDGSWIKSQLYLAPWPIQTVQDIFNKPCNLFPVPTDFFKALEAVSPFSDNHTIYFERELLCSHSSIDTGATHEVAGLPKGPIYNAKYLHLIKNIADKIDFCVPGITGSHTLMFQGKNCRGVIAGHG